MSAFSKLLPALLLHHHNFRILHWNVRGIDFDPVHAAMGDYYEKLSDMIDEIAEIGVMIGVEPVSLQAAIEILENDTDFSYLALQGNESFSSKGCFEKAYDIFTQLINLYEQTYSDSSIPASIINVLQEHQQWFRKECQYKSVRRLK